MLNTIKGEQFETHQTKHFNQTPPEIEFDHFQVFFALSHQSLWEYSVHDWFPSKTQGCMEAVFRNCLHSLQVESLRPTLHLEGVQLL